MYKFTYLPITYKPEPSVMEQPYKCKIPEQLRNRANPIPKTNISTTIPISSSSSSFKSRSNSNDSLRTLVESDLNVSFPKLTVEIKGSKKRKLITKLKVEDSKGNFKFKVKANDETVTDFKLSLDLSKFLLCTNKTIENTSSKRKDKIKVKGGGNDDDAGASLVIWDYYTLTQQLVNSIRKECNYFDRIDIKFVTSSSTDESLSESLKGSSIKSKSNAIKKLLNPVTTFKLKPTKFKNEGNLYTRIYMLNLDPKVWLEVNSDAIIKCINLRLTKI